MAAPPPVTRDQAKVQLLTTMVALKDEILRASDEKVRALKWAALNDFDKDAGSLEALLSQLEERVSGWRGDAPEGTSIVAPLVLKRRETIEARFSEAAMPLEAWFCAVVTPLAADSPACWPVGEDMSAEAQLLAAAPAEYALASCLR